MSPEVERAVPPYLQIAARIRADIESGALAEGAMIPSAREIVTTWGVALATATKVHAQLRSEGLVRSLPGLGTVVSARDVASGGRHRLMSTATRGHLYGARERAVIRSSELIDAPGDVADALGVASTARVVRRERLIERDGEPSSVSVSWLPGEHVEVAPLLLSTRRIRAGTFAYLAQALGTSVVSGREQVSAGRATAEPAALLAVEEGSPVLLVRTWYHAEDGTVVEYGEDVHPAGRWLTEEFVVS